MKRHTKIFLSNIKELEFCGNHFGYQANASAFELPFPIEPTSGEHDFNNCDGCKKMHKRLLRIFTDKYKGNRSSKLPFPLCCASHINLSKKDWFKKSEFDKLNIPEMVANKVIYTKQHIINNYKKPDWFEDITDYIDYAVTSFGLMPTGTGEPLYLSLFLDYLSDLIKTQDYIPENKLNKILDFIDTIRHPVIKQRTDTNILLKTYQDWYKIFPFDLPYFAELKNQFYPTLPKIAYAEVPKINRYSGDLIAKTHTKDTLINALLELTNSLLTQINGATLYEKGLLQDGNQHKLQLVIRKRKLKLKEGYNNNSIDEDTRFRKVLKEWFKDEVKFINEITPLIKSLPPTPEASTEEPQQQELENKFNGMPLNKVIEFFKPLTTELSKNGKPYLTQNQFQAFINRAFCGDLSEEKQTFNVAPKGDKGFLCKRFVLFYNESTNSKNWYDTNPTQAKYISLISDNFKNWTFEDVKSHFRLDVTQRRWKDE